MFGLETPCNAQMVRLLIVLVAVMSLVLSTVADDEQQPKRASAALLSRYGRAVLSRYGKRSSPIIAPRAAASFSPDQESGEQWLLCRKAYGDLLRCEPFNTVF